MMPKWKRGMAVVEGADDLRREEEMAEVDEGEAEASLIQKHFKLCTPQCGIGSYRDRSIHQHQLIRRRKNDV